jgi:hypothetical protein
MKSSLVLGKRDSSQSGCSSWSLSRKRQYREGRYQKTKEILQNLTISLEFAGLNCFSQSEWLTVPDKVQWIDYHSRQVKSVIYLDHQVSIKRPMANRQIVTPKCSYRSPLNCVVHHRSPEAAESRTGLDW